MLGSFFFFFTMIRSIGNRRCANLVVHGLSTVSMDPSLYFAVFLCLCGIAVGQGAGCYPKWKVMGTHAQFKGGKRDSMGVAESVHKNIYA